MSCSALSLIHFLAQQRPSETQFWGVTEQSQLWQRSFPGDPPFDDRREDINQKHLEIFMNEVEDEVKHRYEFCRHIFQLHVSWFTVFSTLNMTVFGWVVHAESKDNGATFRFALFMSIMFTAYNALALGGTCIVASGFRQNRERLLELIPSKALALPYRIYAVTCQIIGCVCIVALVAWVVLPFFVA